MTIRELKNATITHVSYVDKGANQKQFFLTKSEKEPTFNKDVKVMINKDDEKRLVYGVVYEPDVPDAHNDMMKAEEIEKSAHTFLKEYRKIDKQHDFQEGYGEVVESYVAPQDFEVGEETITKGSWVLVTKADEETWEAIKKGEITGYSMAGTAEVEEVVKEEDNQMVKFFKAMKDFFLGETVNKSDFTDEYDKTRKKHNLFDAINMFSDFSYDEIRKTNPDPEKLRSLAHDLGDIMHKVASSTDILKELKDQLEERNEVQVNKEQLEDIINKAVAPINEKLDKLEKEVDTKVEDVNKEKDVEANDTEVDLAKQFEDVLKKQLEPINERLGKVENARGVSKSLDEDAEEDDAKEDSVFKSLFEYRGQL